MKKSKHTPGPWRIITHEEWKNLHQDGAHYFTSISDEKLRTLIAQCADKNSLALTRANARLIAAAPQLLEVCRYAYNQVSGPMTPQQYIDLRQRLESAIAKVDGGKNKKKGG